jgi:catechol 2,3-dioxygenase-like lactoylglutathione lyase family enzyme
VEHAISDLVTRFERGRLTRRELVQALALVAGAGTAASAATLTAGSINHASVLVSDMPRSIDFYNRVFGLSVMNEDKPNKIARLGIEGKVLVSLRVEAPAGLVDHFAIGVQNFNTDAVTRDLQAIGLAPRENLEFGFHVKDPDGANVQITGI